MSEQSSTPPDINWDLTTWEGARREELRRWAALPLENIIAALEEMELTSSAFAASAEPGNTLHEPSGDYTPPAPDNDEPT